MINTVPINDQYSLMIVTLPSNNNNHINNHNPLHAPIAQNNVKFNMVNNNMNMQFLSPSINVNPRSTTNIISFNPNPNPSIHTNMTNMNTPSSVCILLGKISCE